MTLIELINNGLMTAGNERSVWYDGVWLTARDLDSRATQLARSLIADGVEPGAFVGICVERSHDLMIALLGTLRAGAVYVPIDPDYPEQRLRFMMDDAAVPVLLTQQSLLDRLPETDAILICLDTHWPQISGYSSEPLPSRSGPDDLAYMIYTSGSTGRPKGAMNSNAAICNRLVWMQDTFKLTQRDVLLQKTPFSFDVSVWELFWPLINGAKLIIPKPGGHLEPIYMADLIGEHGVSILHFVPSMLQVFLAQSKLRDRCDSLRAVVCSGEALSRELQERFFESLDTELHNLYGPTETAVDVTHWQCRRDGDEKVVPIGWPIANTQIYVLDENMRKVSRGSEGELHIGGVQVGRGYLNREELTLERFVDDPFIQNAGARLYKSGDLARERSDGAFEYLGRLDHQVKIRGVRVELGEIEATLEEMMAIKQAIVLAPEFSVGDQRLVGYYTTETACAIDDARLRDQLAKTLPNYMVPQHFVHMQAMPTTPNGKLDRHALPDPTHGRNIEQIRPTDPIEEFIASLWGETLGLPFVNRDERFFEIGGTSLSAAKIVARLQAYLGEFIYVVSMFDAPTVAEYAVFLKNDYPKALVEKLGLSADTLVSKGDTKGRTQKITDADMTTFSRALPLLNARGQSVSSKEKNPPAIFILAPPRSGTTLLRVMLAGHPGLYSASELQLLCFNTLRERRSAFTGRFSLWLEGTIRCLMDIHDCDVNEASRIMQSMESDKLSTQACYRELQRLVEPKLLVDKSPSYALDPGALQKAESDFDAAIYIHLSRHPFGMIESFERYHIEQVLFLRDQPYRGRQLAELIWQLSHQNVLSFLCGVPEERHYAMRFEDLITDPEAEMRQLCARVDLPYADEMVQPYLNIELKMVDGIHADSIPMGDTRMLERTAIDPAAATAWHRRVESDFLSNATWALAERLGYLREELPFARGSRSSVSQKRRASASARRSRRQAVRRGSK